jgi:hypothetical protein
MDNMHKDVLFVCTYHFLNIKDSFYVLSLNLNLLPSDVFCGTLILIPASLFIRIVFSSAQWEFINLTIFNVVLHHQISSPSVPYMKVLHTYAE